MTNFNFVKSKKNKSNKVKSKSKQVFKDICIPTKKEIRKLKEAYKKGKLHLESKDIAKSILQDKQLKKWLTEE